ncbi:MAG: ABC transporter substrate-binding protein [Lachnospiraceae bacterium]|nr:ABC transporter substrate-binding protein [Lachnospiraceae bacterium]
MKRKLISMACILGMLAASMTGCGSKPADSAESKSQTEAAASSSAETANAETADSAAEATVNTDAILTIASPQTCATLDPVNGYDYWYYLRYGVGETLMKFTEDMTPEPWLVDTYEMEEDQLTWHFTLKDGITFSNGTELTADIAKQCIEKAFADSNTAATYFSYDEITADGQVLTIKTANPAPTLAYILADPVFVIYDLTQDLANVADDGACGTGPFVFKSFDSVTGNCSVVRNDNYWNGDVQCAGIDFVITKDTAAMGMQMKVGEVDAAYSLAYSDMDDFTDNADFNVLTVACGRSVYCFENQAGVLKDEVLRQAVSRGVDKTTYCNDLMKGMYVEGKTPLTSALPYGYDELTDINAFDPDSANDILDKAGYEDKDGDGFRETPDGKPIELSVVFSASRAEIPVIAEAMEINLKDIGVKLKLHEIDQGDHWNTFLAGEYDLLLMSISMTSSGDPQTSMKSYFTTHTEENNNYNSYGYSSDQVDKLYQDLEKEFDLTKRQEIIKEMEQQIMDDSAIITMCYPMLNFVTKSTVSGVTSHPSDYYWVSAETCIAE